MIEEEADKDEERRKDGEGVMTERETEGGEEVEKSTIPSFSASLS